MRLRLFGQGDSQPLELINGCSPAKKDILAFWRVVEFLDDLRNFLLLESSVTTLQFRKISADLLLRPLGILLP